MSSRMVDMLDVVCQTIQNLISVLIKIVRKKVTKFLLDNEEEV